MGIIAPAPQSRQEDSLTLCQNRLAYATKTAVTDGSEISEVCCNRSLFLIHAKSSKELGDSQRSWALCVGSTHPRLLRFAASLYRRDSMLATAKKTDSRELRTGSPTLQQTATQITLLAFHWPEQTAWSCINSRWQKGPRRPGIGVSCAVSATVCIVLVSSVRLVASLKQCKLVLLKIPFWLLSRLFFFSF